MNSCLHHRLQNNHISDIWAISRLPFKKIREVDLSNNNISSIYCLSTIITTSIKKLNLLNNKIPINENRNILNTLKNDKKMDVII